MTHANRAVAAVRLTETSRPRGRSRRRQSARAAIGGLVALWAIACSDQGPSRSIGAARVSLTTVGLDLDADGYTLTLDGGPPQAVTISGSVILTGVTSGAHTLALGDVAANCTPSDANTRALNVIAGDTADATFAVTCTSTFASVSVGYLFACGITIGGGTYCWGINEYGQLGDGDPTGPAQCLVYIGRDVSYPCSNTPVPVIGELRFAAASAGSWPACGITAGSAGASRTCGVTTAGAAYCWGDNTYGQLGDGTTPSRPIPVRVLGGLTFASVSAAAGGVHTCGIATDGATYCWGGDAFGELGDGTTTNRTS